MTLTEELTNQLSKLPEETIDDYHKRLYILKCSSNLEWRDISPIYNDEVGRNYSVDVCRKRCRESYLKSLQTEDNNTEVMTETTTTEVVDTPSSCSDNCTDKIIELTKAKNYTDKIIALTKAKNKLSDERTQINALIRRISREETLKEIAIELAKNREPVVITPSITSSGDKVGVLMLSDWHFGLETSNVFNTYNPEIAIERLNKLVGRTIEICRRENVGEINVFNLGDLISGRIHLQLRINNRYDVIQQTMIVSELMESILISLRKAGFVVKYFDCLDNHSRIEPNKHDSLDLESMVGIIHWYLDKRFENADGITIVANNVSSDIITTEILGWKVAGVHGDKDKPSDVVKNISLLTNSNYDLICTAHLHHFSCDENNSCVVVSNPCIMGTDDYAFSLRLKSTPAQNLIIVSEENQVEAIHRITV